MTRCFALILLLAGSSFSAIAQDTLAPKIELKGEPAFEICICQTFVDLGYIVTDNLDSAAKIAVIPEGSIFQNIRHDSLLHEGVFSLRYKAIDRAGNVGYSPWRAIMVGGRYSSACDRSLCWDGIKERDNLPIFIYPNPTTKIIRVGGLISSPSFTLTDASGKNIPVTFQQHSPNDWEISLSNNPIGIYFLYITNDKSLTVRKIYLTR